MLKTLGKQLEGFRKDSILTPLNGETIVAFGYYGNDYSINDGIHYQ